MFELSEAVEEAADQEEIATLHRDVLIALDDVGSKIQGIVGIIWLGWRQMRLWEIEGERE